MVRHIALALHVFVALNDAPLVGPDLVAVHVAENVRLISASVDIELIEVAYKAVVGARLWRIFRVQSDPLFLNRLELSQIVEVDSTLSGVAAK